MSKRILSVLILAVMLVSAALGTAVHAADGEAENQIVIKSTVYDAETGTLTMTFANTGAAVRDGMLLVSDNNDPSLIAFSEKDYITYNYRSLPGAWVGNIGAGSTKEVIFHLTALADPENPPVVEGVLVAYSNTEAVDAGQNADVLCTYENIFVKDEAPSYGQVFINFLKQTGFSMIAQNWKVLVMIVIACALLYLAIGKGFEPLLLVPIAFGMLLTNLPGAGLFHEELFANGHVHWELFSAAESITPGLIDYLYLGVKLGIYPCLIFFGVGAMTDFAPLIANPKSLLLGAAAQVGIFLAYIGATLLGFLPTEAGSIGIIGGADGPTAIFVTSKLAPHLLGPIAVAAYSYMALVPVIQPPIMKLLTTKKERQIKMVALREVSKKEKIVFPIVVTIFVALLVPSAAPLVGALMLGNLFRECGVTERLSKTVQNELMNIVTIFLGISVGATATASTFLSWKTLGILAMGVTAFACGTAGGVLLAKFMNLFLKKKINPLIGSAGVSAVPMAARVSQTVGQKENPSNFLLMHAMGPNVAGVIGSAIAAVVLIALFGYERTEGRCPSTPPRPFLKKGSWNPKNFWRGFFNKFPLKVFAQPFSKGWLGQGRAALVSRKDVIYVKKTLYNRHYSPRRPPVTGGDENEA